MTTTRKPTTTKRTRTRATTGTAPAVVPFPQSVLGYLQIAVQGPLGPGGIAHRIKRYHVTGVDRNGHPCRIELVGPACGQETTRPGPNHDTDPDDTETVPVTICRDHGAAFAQAHGVTRCTNTQCWPVRPDEAQPGGWR